MPNPSSPPLLARARIVTCTLVTLTVACGAEPTAPQSLSVQQASVEAERPYYLYEGRPVYLEVDPTRLTVSEPEEGAEAALAASLAHAGLAGAWLERLPLEPNAFTVHLAKGTSAQQALLAAEVLRREGRHGFVANVYQAPEGEGEVVLHNRLVVHLKKGFGAEALAPLQRDLGLKLLREPQGGSEEYLLAYPEGVEPLEFALRVGRRPEVEWVDPDKTGARQLHAVPADPSYGLQYYARNATTVGGVRVDTNVEWAWDLTYGAWSAAAGPFVVAIVDDGVETSHPDLGSVGVLGYDALTNTWGSWGCSDCATNPLGNYSHGTLVAGVIKAQHNNALGIAGLAPAVKLLPIRIFRNGVSGSDSQIAMGIDAAWQNDAQVISNSWGGSVASNAITAAINRATTQGRGGRGSVVVFSAGNTSDRSVGNIGGVLYPGSLSNVLTVSAINRNGGLTNYAPEGAAIDIVAPTGHTTGACIGDVVSTDLMGTRGCNDGPGGDIDFSSTFSGTSAAAPQVAAVAAMVLARNTTLTEAQARSQITVNADPWGPATRFGAGKLNAYRALVGRTRVTIAGNSVPSSPGTYTYTANATGGVGGYTYLWTRSYIGGDYVIGTGASVNVGVYENDAFTLKVQVTNGPDVQTVTASRLVRGPIACPNPSGGSIKEQCPTFSEP